MMLSRSLFISSTSRKLSSFSPPHSIVAKTNSLLDLPKATLGIISTAFVRNDLMSAVHSSRFFSTTEALRRSPARWQTKATSIEHTTSQVKFSNLNVHDNLFHVLIQTKISHQLRFFSSELQEKKDSQKGDTKDNSKTNSSDNPPKEPAQGK